MAPNYHNANSPYGSGDPYYNESSGYITPMPVKKGTSKWIKVGIPVAVVAVIIAAVVGGVVGSRHHSSSSSVAGGASSGGGSSGDQASAASAAASVKKAIGVFPTGTDSQYLLPLYPSTVSAALLCDASLAILTRVTFVRQIPPLSPPPHSTPPPTPPSHGRKTPSSRRTPSPRVSGRIARASLPRSTSCRLFPTLSQVIHT